MGYDLYEISRTARLERHNGPGDEADNEAFARFSQEVSALIDSDPDYSRIFNYGQRVDVAVIGLEE